MADSVSAADSSTGVTYVSSSSNTNKGLSVDTETFLKLLVAQLQYQDPLEPQTDTQFVTQLAQMSTLEQMQSMGLSMSSTQAYSMIGKVVYAEVLDKTTGITNQYLGVVESVLMKNGKPYVVMSNVAIDVNDITQVFYTPDELPDPETDSETETDPAAEE